LHNTEVHQRLTASYRYDNLPTAHCTHKKEVFSIIADCYPHYDSHTNMEYEGLMMDSSELL
jgi:hypothetical protein